jgi:hypothetical protein
MRLRNGLGRFSSSERSYPFGTGIAAAVFVAAHGSVDPGRELTDFEDRDDDVSPVGAEADTGRVIAFWRGALRTDPRMDGFRRRVGGTAVECDGSLVDEAEAVISGLVLSRIDGDGGKSMPPSPSSASEFSPASSKSNILANSILTFGGLTKSLASSAGVGVANGWPVSVRMTPFIAEKGTSSLLGRLIGVSSVVLVFIKEKSCDRR